MPQSTKLPNADFFLLWDSRIDEGWLDNQFDETEPWSGEASEETQRIYQGRCALMRILDPTLPEANLWKSEFAVPGELVHTRSWFNTRKPARLHHYESVLCFSQKAVLGHPDPYDSYNVVSTRWKQAIEDLDPGVHEFFPHAFKFKDGEEPGRFVFRSRIQVKDCLHPGGRPYQKDNPFTLYWKDDKSTHVNARIDRKRIGEHHWIECITHNDAKLMVVSGALAFRLAPLVPDDMYLWPLS
jgi:hypothetical protein